jgi:hypothetical protein
MMGSTDLCPYLEKYFVNVYLEGLLKKEHYTTLGRRSTFCAG